MNPSEPDHDGREVRRLAVRVLCRVEQSGAFAGILLESHERSLSDPRDRALLHEIVLGVLRWRSLLDHMIAGASSRPLDRLDAAVRNALRVGVHAMERLDRVPEFAAVDTAVEAARSEGASRAAGFVNGVLRTVARDRDRLRPAPPAKGDARGLAQALGHPGWWVDRLVRRLGWTRAGALLEADNQPAPVSIRVRTARTTAAEVARRLQQDGIVVEASPWLPDALRIVEGSIPGAAALEEGLLYVQDEASQLVAWLFGPALGRRVADLCAAPGGKALQLAERLGEDGVVVALDRSPARLGRLMQNAARLACREVLPVAGDATRWPVPLAGGFEQVLLDAPCSGTGTFRRHPEIRWRLRPDTIDALAAGQRQLLRNAARLVAPGGTLVYSVCSLEPEEGEDVVASFLEGAPGFRRTNPSKQLPEAARGFLEPSGYLRTSPADGPLDGFFAARMDRDP